jgi:suppressor of G2 allele of SKP1
MEDLTAEASLSLADSFHVDENYSDAIDAYAAAISVLRESEVALHIRALSHRSTAFYKLERYEEALEDANKALELLSSKGGPSGLRPGEGEICHKRSGLAAFKLQKYSPAKESLQKAAQLASLNNRSDASYLEWIQKCDEALNPSTPSSVVAEQKQPPKTESSTAKPSAPPSVEAKPAPQPASATTTTAAALPSAASNNKRPTMPKYQYYQSDKVMTISILESNVKAEDLNVTFDPKRLTVILRKGGVDFTVIAGTLYNSIDVERSKVVIKDEKVLLKLRKEEAFEWHELFGKANDSKPAAAKKPPSASDESIPKAKDAAIPRPYSSDRDWDAIEKSVIEDEKNEKPEGDEAMNKLFQQIYGNASEETRRAMIKSYQTSGGTVLSTNWDEVGKTDYEKERTAPKGMEWKNWEGDKLPMKDDD